MKEQEHITNQAAFKKHHKRLVATIKRHPLIDALVIVCGSNEQSTKSRVKAFTYWYMGVDLQEVIIAVTRKKVIILAELGVAQGLEFMTDNHDIVFLKKSTRHNDNEEQIGYMFQHIQTERNDKHLSIAFPLKDQQQGVLQDELDRYLRKHRELSLQDAAQIMTTALQVKDKRELGRMKNSGLLCSYLMKKFISWVEQAIDKQDKVKHAHMSKRMETFMREPSELQIMEHHCQLLGPFGLSYTPVLQSGGRYDFSSQQLHSNHDVIQPDIIVVQLGAKFFGYNTNCIRTMLINPDHEIRLLYNVILGCYQELVDKLKPGIKLRKVYQAVKSQWWANCPTQYRDKFPDNLGWGIGIEQRENSLKINHQAGAVVHVGMCFHIRLAVEGLDFSTLKNYAMCVGDTISMVESNLSVVLTTTVDRSLKKISFQLSDVVNSDLRSGFMRLVREQPTMDQSQDQLLQQLKHSQTYFQEISLKHQEFNQEALKLKKQFELEERVFGKQWPDKGLDKRINMLQLESYKTYEPLPSSLQKARFFIDTQTSSLLVPMRGVHIPFHVTTIKNITLESRFTTKACKYEQDDEGRYIQHLMRIHFWTSETSVSNRIYPDLHTGELFIKEIMYSSNTMERLEDYSLLITELQKQAKLKFIQKMEAEPTFLDQTQVLIIEPLILNIKREKVVLNRMRVRPLLTNCKASDGILECHLNGFRYVSQKDECVDIPYKSVKHYIYQSPEEEIIAGIHLHLKGPLVIGKRRSTDIQFYREVPGAIECLENKRKQQLTQMDLEFEQNVRKQRKDMLQEVEQFIWEVEHFTQEHAIKFERPIRNIAFEGNWNRARLFLQPAQNCIVNVVESPFFIVTTSEIDIACFERIMVGVKTFDIVFVYKSYDKGWVRIESIDRCHLEPIQQWLNQRNILFFMVNNTLMWKNMMFTITRDFKAFVHEGGWAKIMMEQVDHAPLHNYLDDGSSIFQPLTSDGLTSFSDEIPELIEQEEQNKNFIYEEENVSQIANSNDLLGLQELLSDRSDDDISDTLKVLKKIKPNIYI